MGLGTYPLWVNCFNLEHLTIQAIIFTIRSIAASKIGLLGVKFTLANSANSDLIGAKEGRGGGGRLGKLDEWRERKGVWKRPEMGLEGSGKGLEGVLKGSRRGLEWV